ncbi:MAG: hypothetical protein WBD16_00845 [Pyrinomonadaceae bacterium]
MRLFCVVILLLTSNLTATPQTKPPVLAHYFAPPMEEFTVNVPCVPREVENEEEWKIYKCSIGNKWFFITSNKDEESSQLEEIKRQASTETTSNKELIESFSPAQSQHFAFADYDGLFQQVIALRSSRRFYIFHVISDIENDSVADSFFRSVNINNQPRIDRPKPKNPKSILSVLQTRKITSGYISRENAFLYKNLNQGPNYVPAANQTSPLKVLEKKSPAYTPLAFLYAIQGEILIRAVFKESAEIGIITPVKKLPLGLTANAIEATRFIKFDPPVEKGKAKTITKTVAFQFSIY